MVKRRHKASLMAMILTNATLATMSGGYGLIEAAALIVEDGRIAWVGPMVGHPSRDLPVHDLGGRLVTPALIDCHSHIVFAGHRALEFEMRLNGASYAEVARAGAGPPGGNAGDPPAVYRDFDIPRPAIGQQGGSGLQDGHGTLA